MKEMIFVYNAHTLSMFKNEDPASLIETLEFPEITSISLVEFAPDCLNIRNLNNKLFMPCLGNLENVNGFLNTFR